MASDADQVNVQLSLITMLKKKNKQSPTSVYQKLNIVSSFQTPQNRIEEEIGKLLDIGLDPTRSEVVGEWEMSSMASSTDTTWVGKKPLRRIGGMSDALSIAADLGFSVAPPPTQVSLPLCVPNFPFCAHFW